MRKLCNKLRKVIKTPSLIILKLMNMGMFNFLSDELYIKWEYKMMTKNSLHLNNPQAFNEKLQWLKLYDRNPEYTKMVDKYEAKKYVANIIGEEYIIPTLGIYDKFEDIDFSTLPNQFVLKPTHTSGDIFICKDKNQIDYKKLKKQVDKWLKREYYYVHREWTYKNVKPRIIVEKYMGDDQQKELIDYKFFCFNGIPKFLYISEGLSNHATAKISFVDMEYNLMKFHRKDYKPFNEIPPKPKNFEKMKKLAQILSSKIPFIRVDFYEIKSKVYFGELTFYPCSGYVPFELDEYDKILGDILKLPKKI